MGFRYRKNLALGKSGVRVNLSKSGVGLSAGVPGMRVGAGPTGARVTAGIPGTGLSYESRSRARRSTPRPTSHRISAELALEPLMVPIDQEVGRLLAIHPTTTFEGRTAIAQGVADMAYRLSQEQGRLAAAGKVVPASLVPEHVLLTAIRQQVLQASAVEWTTPKVMGSELTGVLAYAAGAGFSSVTGRVSNPFKPRGDSKLGFVLASVAVLVITFFVLATVV